MSSIGVVILAAGDGKRMKTGIPKVMNPLRGEPLVSHVVKAAEQVQFGLKPVVVVCANHTLVQDYLGDRAQYAVQIEQLGTAHAVGVALPQLIGKVDSVVVLYGDMPFITSESLRHLVSVHTAEHNVVTLMTVKVSDFNEWRAQFADFGRIKRDEHGAIVSIVEKKDATPEELVITELNTSYFCFDAAWLSENIERVKNENAQKEYYLVDLIRMAREQAQKIGTVLVDPKEAIGINTKEHLAIAEAL